MRLDDAFTVVPVTLPGDFDRFAQHVILEWIEDTLAVTGNASIRVVVFPRSRFCGSWSAWP